MDDFDFPIVEVVDDNNNDNNNDEDNNKPKPLEKLRCYHLLGGRKHGVEKLKASRLQQIEEQLQSQVEEPAFRIDLHGRKIYKEDEETRMRRKFHAEADEHQISMMLSWTAKRYGPGSDEFRDIVNARARGELVLRPVITPRPSNVPIPRPELALSSNLKKELGNYTKAEMDNECTKAHRNYVKSLGLSEDDYEGECQAAKFISNFSQPIEGIQYREETSFEELTKPWNPPKLKPNRPN